jgi:flavin-binding protein dodecin
MSVYKIIQLVGTSETSWEDAAKTAVEMAGQHLKNLRIAEVDKLDLKIEKTLDLKIFNEAVQLPIDKTSLFSGFIHGQKNNERTVFTFHKHNTKEFLGFPQSYFYNINFLKQISSVQNKNVLNEFLTGNDKHIGQRITMKNKEGKPVKVELQKSEQRNPNVKLFIVPNDPTQQKLAVLFQNNSITTVWAYTYYTAGSSVRIMLKKN